MKFQNKILLIEDDPYLGATLQNILTFAKYDVFYSINGASGIQKAFQYNPDLILCDINMDPIDGYQVYKVLEESSILTRIPFIFLTGSADLDDIRYGMTMGADDYLVKPIKSDVLIRTIEKRLEKFSAFRNEARRDFNRLFDISPVGMVLFDGKKIVKINTEFRKIAITGQSEKELSMEDFLDSESVQKLSQKIDNYQNDQTEIFSDLVSFSNKKNGETSMKLVVSEFEKFSNYNLYLGIFTPETEDSESEHRNGYANELYKLLRRENIKITEELGHKITEIFKAKRLDYQNYSNQIFTERENQVLYLSMEGLPIKIIADRLHISDRTVEKYRTKLMEKTGSSNMIEVIVYALKNSLIEI